MAQGNGAFVIAELCNRVNAEGTKEEKRLLQTWFTGGGISESIRDKEMKGKSVLLENIKALLST
jgi:pumilio family protein 6